MTTVIIIIAVLVVLALAVYFGQRFGAARKAERDRLQGVAREHRQQVDAHASTVQAAQTEAEKREERAADLQRAAEREKAEADALTNKAETHREAAIEHHERVREVEDRIDKA